MNPGLDPNAMTEPEHRKVVKQDNKRQAQAEASAKKGAYKRLMKNPDFLLFYNHLEMCYNSYIESGGEPNLPRHTREFLLIQGATLKKQLDFINRQAK